jgi:predicted ATPase
MGISSSSATQQRNWTSHSSPAAGNILLCPFIGRDEQVARVRALLQRRDVRLVTLTGPGGIGKTSLALRVARDLERNFVHGVLFVSLVSIRDPELFLSMVIQALGLQNAGAEPAIQRLCAHLRHRELLLELDNFEQLITAAPLLAERAPPPG